MMRVVAESCPLIIRSHAGLGDSDEVFWPSSVCWSVSQLAPSWWSARFILAVANPSIVASC